jgi:hypothetical protein
MEKTAEISNSNGQVVRSIEEIQSRIDDLKNDIIHWSKERFKASNSDYGIYCTEIITELTGKRDALEWVLQLRNNL